MRTVLMGTPHFAIPALLRLHEISLVVGVITQPDRPAGRGRVLTPPPVKVKALELGLPVLQPASIKSPEVMATLAEWEPDVTIVAAYGQILPKRVLDAPPVGSINVHASLLPRWRGAAPVQAAIAAGDDETGVTLMKMDPGLDTGPILVQRTTTIRKDETGGQLADRLAELGGNLLAESLQPYVSGEVRPHPQDGALATYAPMLKKLDGLLDPTRSAEQLALQVRGYDPWPGTYLQVGETRLAVLEAHSTGRQQSQQPGRILSIDGMPALSCSPGLLLLTVVRPAGKTSMPGDAYLRGAPNIVGTPVGASHG